MKTTITTVRVLRRWTYAEYKYRLVVWTTYGRKSYIIERWSPNLNAWCETDNADWSVNRLLEIMSPILDKQFPKG